MNSNKLKIYAMLSHVPFLQKNYEYKAIIIAWIGIFFPVLVLLGSIIIDPNLQFNKTIFLFVLISVFSAIVTAVLLTMLLYPIQLATEALYQYINEEEKKQLPSGYSDSVGQLLTYVQYAIEKIELLNKSVLHASNIDPLTGIQNRRAGEEHLRQDMARARRAESLLLVAMIDVDKLEHINEQFGYHVGDVCLTQIADVLGHSIREGDWIARWDGDEFIMVLWNFNHTNPHMVLDRIRQQTIKTPMGELLEISLSIGACEYKGETDLETDTDLETLLIHLEEALSQAKQYGRGGIALCDE